MLKVTVTPVSFSSIGSGCFHLVGKILTELAGDYGQAVELLELKPYFDDLETEVYQHEGQFIEFRRRLAELPIYTFSRETGVITIEYLSKVCSGKDLLEKANVPNKHSLREFESARLLEDFFRELIEVVRGLEQAIASSDDFETGKFLNWLPTLIDELPVDNLAVLQLSQRRSDLDSADVKPRVDHSSAMTEQQFWDIVNHVDKRAMSKEHQHVAIEPVVAKLSEMTVREIYAFHNHLCNALFALDTKAHFESAPSPMTDDGFLCYRCYIVGLGSVRYAAVLADAKSSPRDYKSLELLVTAAPTAWAQVTGDDDENFDKDCFDKSYESCANRAGWGIIPNRLYSIGFGDTRESVEAMLSADRREKASLGVGLHDTSFFVEKLNELELNLRCESIAIDLNPSMEHGTVRLLTQYNRSRVVRAEGGLDAVRYVALSPLEREYYFIDLAAESVLTVLEVDDVINDKVQSARECAKAQIRETFGSE